MTKTHVLALDQGTTSCRAILFDREGLIASRAQAEFRQSYPQPGWVEHDPEEIWRTQLAVAEEALNLARLRPGEIAAIGITNQRETTVVWNRKTGAPLAPAIVWQDRRTAAACEELRASRAASVIENKTGLIVDAYFSATKLRWILDHVPGAAEQAARGELAAGTIDSWLLWKLTGGDRLVTDVSNASRTMLLNLRTGAWDEELLELFRLPRELLPEVRSSSEVYGEATVPALGGIRIAGVAGDQQAALFGQACTKAGMAKNTYGTGCFLLLHTGAEPVASQYRLLTTLTARREGRPLEYALEGSVFNAGAAVQWLRDGLQIIRQASEIEALARSVPDSGGIYLVPAFTGLGAPHWDADARGAITGLTRGTTGAHLARATLESIALQTLDVLEAMSADAALPLRELRVDGGAAVNDLLLQIQADLAGVEVVRPTITETTALGAAFLAGLAVGFWSGEADIARQWRAEKIFVPSMAEGRRSELLAGWKDAVARTRSHARQPGPYSSSSSASSSTPSVEERRIS